VHLEVEVERRALGVARVPDEAEDIAGADVPSVDGERRVGGEVGVVELVSALVAEPEAVAADVVPADLEDGAVGDREDRRAEGGEDVVAVVPAAGDVTARRPEGIAVPGGTVHREDVAVVR
jgi:hypothetical protein